METGPQFIVPSDGLESPGSNLHPLVYKASDITMAPRRLLVCCVMAYPSNKVMAMGPWFNINVWFTESCLVWLQGKGYDNSHRI